MEIKFKKILSGKFSCKEKDWSTEYLSATVSVKIVKNVKKLLIILINMELCIQIL